MIDERAAAEIAGIVAVWGASGCRLPDPSRRAVVAALLHELDRDEPRAESSWLEPVYVFDPSLELELEDTIRLREAVETTLVTSRPAAEAIQARLALGALLDELLLAVTRRQVRLLEQSARSDALTGLDNRRAATDALERAFAHARRHGRPLAVAIIDLDGLKAINDGEGHAAGDAALRQLAAALRSNLRAGDRAARVGGDEFIVIATDSRDVDLERLLERVRHSAPQFSYGIAGLDESIADPDELVALADSDLYANRRRAAAGGSTTLDAWRAIPAGLAVGLTASVVAEVLRRRTGVAVTGNAAHAWIAFLYMTPLATGLLTVVRASDDLAVAVRRAGAIAGLALLAMVAALTPLLSMSLKERAAEVADVSPPTTVVTPPVTRPSPTIRGDQPTVPPTTRPAPTTTVTTAVTAVPPGDAARSTRPPARLATVGGAAGVDTSPLPGPVATTVGATTPSTTVAPTPPTTTPPATAPPAPPRPTVPATPAEPEAVERDDDRERDPVDDAGGDDRPAPVTRTTSGPTAATVGSAGPADGERRPGRRPRRVDERERAPDRGRDGGRQPERARGVERDPAPRRRH